MDGIAPENGGILRSENQLTIYSSLKDGGQQDKIVTTWPKMGIREQENPVEFGKQFCANLLSLAMSPTNGHGGLDLGNEDFELKASVSRIH